MYKESQVDCISYEIVSSERTNFLLLLVFNGQKVEVCVPFDKETGEKFIKDFEEELNRLKYKREDATSSNSLSPV